MKVFNLIGSLFVLGGAVIATSMDAIHTDFNK